MNWRWVSRQSVEIVHQQQLERFGGAGGVRDQTMPDSAIDRPENKAAYGKPDVFDLAAAYLFGLARNHPFIDGNKRTAIVVAAIFLMKNGYQLTASEALLYQFVMDVAAGAVSEDNAARWFRDFTERRT